jgi:replication initiation and membrane attachment protein DnaB
MNLETDAENTDLKKLISELEAEIERLQKRVLESINMEHSPTRPGGDQMKGDRMKTRLQNHPEHPDETHLILSYTAMRDLYFLLNQNKSRFQSEDLQTVHRLLGISYREARPFSAEEASQ